MQAKFLVILAALFFSLSFSQRVKKLSLKPFKIAVLSDSLRETSGLAFFDKKLFTFNDSGHKSELFELNLKSGAIEEVHSTRLTNKDWEALATDSAYFYIGDFGNNGGTRKDLKIFKIPVKEDGLMLDSVKTIRFFYPEQTSFVPQYLAQDFDAEAMVVYNDRINVFTKAWKTKLLARYLIREKDNAAQLVESYQLPYVVTDATVYNHLLYVVGYTKTAQVFLSIFEANAEGLFFKQAPKTFRLGRSTVVGQIEGIAANEEGLYISGEFFNFKIGKVKQSLYYIPYDKIE